ncbi:MAG: hypothetical protein NTV34_13595, partial [Proteobacteria bacterium]|nr:hypothetical protein [Pseudomonadota bacterium]
MLKIIACTMVVAASSAHAGERLFGQSVKAAKAAIELGQAYASGADADIWGQSSVSIKFDPPLRLGNLLVASLGAGIEGQSHSDANFLNSYFDQGPHELDFELRTESRVSWDTSKHECSFNIVDRTTIIN